MACPENLSRPVCHAVFGNRARQRVLQTSGLREPRRASDRVRGQRDCPRGLVVYGSIGNRHASDGSNDGVLDQTPVDHIVGPGCVQFVDGGGSVVDVGCVAANQDENVVCASGPRRQTAVCGICARANALDVAGDTGVFGRSGHRGGDGVQADVLVSCPPIANSFDGWCIGLLACRAAELCARASFRHATRIAF